MSQTPTSSTSTAKFILLGIVIGVVAGLAMWGLLVAVGVDPGYGSVAVPIIAVGVFFILRSGRARRT